MADPQDRPDSESDDASAPPAKQPPAKAVKKTAKAPAKKAPAKGPEPAPPKAAAQPLGLQQRIETNGQLDAAKVVAAQAKSTVEAANNPVSGDESVPAPRTSPVPLAVALALSLLAILLIRQLRRR